MTTGNDPAKVQAVRAYLDERFPGAYIIHGTEFDTQAETFTVTHGDAVYHAHITHEFLEDLTPEEIKQRLVEWNLADRLLLSGESLVIITRFGFWDG
jgi:hypothetical protein